MNLQTRSVEEWLRKLRAHVGGPHEANVAAVARWAGDAGVRDVAIGPDWVELRGDVRSIGAMFGLDGPCATAEGPFAGRCLAVHRHASSGTETIAATSGAGHTVPAKLRGRIALVTGIHELIPGAAAMRRRRRQQKQQQKHQQQQQQQQHQKRQSPGRGSSPWVRADILVAGEAARRESPIPGFNATLAAQQDPGLTYLVTPDAVRALYGVPPGARVLSTPGQNGLRGGRGVLYFFFFFFFFFLKQCLNNVSSFIPLIIYPYSLSVAVGVVSHGNRFSESGLATFSAAVGLDPAPNATVLGGDPSSLDPVDGGDITVSADTAVQYAAAVSRAERVGFWTYPGRDGEFWLLDWAKSIDAAAAKGGAGLRGGGCLRSEL
jgi:hypothetical protein